MRKLLKFAGFIMVLYLLFYLGTLLADHYVLHDRVIRLHVVANSDSADDQGIKLRVKDAVVDYLNEACLDTTEDARLFLSDHLCDIEDIANKVLAANGRTQIATVTFCKEPFGIRDYETFSLPSGIYQSLRVEIGDGQGKNWWCVVFPALCVPTTGSEFVEAAVSSGFDSVLADTLEDNERYEVRFFLLDCFGKIENFLCNL